MRDYLARSGTPGARRWYDETLVSDDLRYHLDVLREGDAAYRAAFMAHAGAFLATAGPGVEDRLPAIQRLKWRLVREERLDDLLALLDQPPTRVRGMDLLARRARQALTALRPAQVPLPARPDSYASTTAPTRSRTPSLDNKAAT